MLVSRFLMPVFGFALSISVADAQLNFQRVADFRDPTTHTHRFTGGREVVFAEDGNKLIAAFYGSTAQLFDVKENEPIGKPLRTAGDGEVGFVNLDIAYTADWDSVRLWDTKSGQQIGEPIPHELREDTIIRPAIHPEGTLIATRASLRSIQIRDVATRRMIGRSRNYSADVVSLRFSENGAFLFVKAGGSLHVIDAETGDDVTGPIKSGRSFRFFPSQQVLVTIEQAGEGVHQLVFRDTSQTRWPETHRSGLPGKVKRLVALPNDRVMVQTSAPDFTPRLFTIPLDAPKNRVAVESNADRAFRLIVTQDNKRWICSNIHDISCYQFGQSDPAWQKAVPPSGYDQQIFPLNDEHFIICNREEDFRVYRVSDGEEVWAKTDVKRFSLAEGKIAFCTNAGVEVWSME